jgi:hypothetical protein
MKGRELSAAYWQIPLMGAVSSVQQAAVLALLLVVVSTNLQLCLLLPQLPFNAHAFGLELPGQGLLRALQHGVVRIHGAGRRPQGYLSSCCCCVPLQQRALCWISHAVQVFEKLMF